MGNAAITKQFLQFLIHFPNESPPLPCAVLSLRALIPTIDPIDTKNNTVVHGSSPFGRFSASELAPLFCHPPPMTHSSVKCLLTIIFPGLESTIHLDEDDATTTKALEVKFGRSVFCFDLPKVHQTDFSRAVASLKIVQFLKTEQARITTEVITAKARLAVIDGDFATAETNLRKALALARDCEAAYSEASDKVRRQFNQIFFKRLLIDDQYQVIGELAEPFETLLGDEIRLAATSKAEAELQTLVDGAFDSDDHERPSADEGVLTLTGSSLSNPAPHSVQGLKEKTMVGAGV